MIPDYLLRQQGGRQYGRQLVSEGNAPGEGQPKPGKVRPFLGVGTPAPTEFGYHYVELGAHFQTAIQSRVSAHTALSVAQLRVWADHLVEGANATAQREEIAFRETAEALFFQGLANSPLELP